MNSKPIILVFVHFYLPGYKSGGPLRTIANIIDHLSDDFEFRVFCLDRDALDTSPYEGIKVNSWNHFGKSKVFYCSPKNFNYTFIKSFLRKESYDLLYLNSFFSIETSFYPILIYLLKQINARSVLLAPRGQFSEEALKIKKLRKALYLRFFKISGLCSSVLWHASSSFEEKDIKSVFGNKVEVLKAIDLPAKNSVELQLEVKDRDSLNVLFLSRIDPMKNLNYALDTLGKIDQKNINFNIYGPIRVPEYWEMCKKNIARLPSNIVVNYQGALKHNEVFEIFAKNDLFFLPSAGENYGHAIFEAMLAGVPVLISDRTPWRNLEKEGVGWDFNLNQIESFIEAIKKVYLMKPEEHYKWREKIRNWALIKQTNEKDIENNRQLFKYAIQKFKKG